MLMMTFNPQLKVTGESQQRCLGPSSFGWNQRKSDRGADDRSKRRFVPSAPAAGAQWQGQGQGPGSRGGFSSSRRQPANVSKALSELWELRGSALAPSRWVYLYFIYYVECQSCVGVCVIAVSSEAHPPGPLVCGAEVPVPISSITAEKESERRSA